MSFLVFVYSVFGWQTQTASSRLFHFHPFSATQKARRMLAIEFLLDLKIGGI